MSVLRVEVVVRKVDVGVEALWRVFYQLDSGLRSDVVFSNPLEADTDAKLGVCPHPGCMAWWHRGVVRLVRIRRDDVVDHESLVCGVDDRFAFVPQAVGSGEGCGVVTALIRIRVVDHECSRSQRNTAQNFTAYCFVVHDFRTGDGSRRCIIDIALLSQVTPVRKVGGVLRIVGLIEVGDVGSVDILAVIDWWPEDFNASCIDGCYRIASVGEFFGGGGSTVSKNEVSSDILQYVGDVANVNMSVEVSGSRSTVLLQECCGFLVEGRGPLEYAIGHANGEARPVTSGVHYVVRPLVERVLWRAVYGERIVGYTFGNFGRLNFD